MNEIKRLLAILNHDKDCKSCHAKLEYMAPETQKVFVEDVVTDCEKKEEAKH